MHAALVLALACQGCASRLPRPVDTDVARSVRSVTTERALVRVEQSGSTLTMHATRICDLRAYKTVDREESFRYTVDHTSEAVFPLLVVGNALGVIGGITFHASLATAEEDLAPDLAVAGVTSAVGAALVGAGIALLQSRKRTGVTRTRLEVNDGLVTANVPCKEVNPAARVPVTGKVLGPPALEIPFGDTDARGALVIDLADAVPLSLLRDPPAGATLTLYLGEVEVGKARLDMAARAPRRQPVSEEGSRP